MLHTEIIITQESPPAWTQEAYRPPRSKYTLCCSSWGYLHLNQGPILEWGTPKSWPGMGYLPSWPEMRYPQSWPEMGVPTCPDLGWGTPFWPEMGYSPMLTWDGGTPHCQQDMGTPHQGVNWQTENSTFPHSSDVGSNKFTVMCNIF